MLAAGFALFDLGFGFLSGPSTMIMLRPSSFAADSTLAMSVNLLNNAVQNLLARLGVGRLSSAEHDGDLHLVTLVQEFSTRRVLVSKSPGPIFGSVLHLLDAYV